MAFAIKAEVIDPRARTLGGFLGRAPPADAGRFHSAGGCWRTFCHCRRRPVS